MKKIYANNFTTLALGRQGENLASQVMFDLTDLVQGYGDGAAELLYQRPGDSTPYPVAAVRDGDMLVWTLTATDTDCKTNYGRCELRYYVGETLVKTKTWRTWVEPAMYTPSETVPPAPEQGWVDQVVFTGAAAKESADTAKVYADRAAALAADVAANAAQTAQAATESEQAKEAAQEAQRLADAAQLAAEAAKQAAETARAASVQSATDADDAKQATESAAEKAMSDIQEQYQQMQTWANGVVHTVAESGSNAVQSVQTAGDEQTQRVTNEGTKQTANAKEQADAAARYAEEASAFKAGAEDAKNKAEIAASRQPYPNTQTGTWWVWDPQGEAYRDSGASSSGLPGDPGADGQDGKSAYQAAQDGGYTGTEQEFNAALASVSDKYEKPSTGIPKQDLDGDVQTSLAKADSALSNGSGMASWSGNILQISGNEDDPNVPNDYGELFLGSSGIGVQFSPGYRNQEGAKGLQLKLDGHFWAGGADCFLTGIKDGTAPNDAVNKAQLDEKITAPATASIGQVICVKAVDEAGRPTEWEAANQYQLYRHYVEFTSETWDGTGFTAELLLTDDTPIESLSEFSTAVGKSRNITVIPHDYLIDINGKWNDALETYGAPNGEVQILPFALYTSQTIAYVKCHMYILDYEQTNIVKYKYCGYFRFIIDGTYPGDLQITDQVTPV